MGDETKLNIYLIRHGEKSEDGSTLSKDGLIQVKLLANRLKKIKIHRIYSSNLQRCKLTAETISKINKVKIVYDTRLREVSGEVKEKPSKYPKEIEKIRKFWEKITSKERGHILVVGSGNVNRILLAIVMGISPTKSRFVQIPSGLTHLEFVNPKKTRFVYVNDTSHLPERLKRKQSY